MHWPHDIHDNVAVLQQYNDTMGEYVVSNTIAEHNGTISQR